MEFKKVKSPIIYFNNFLLGICKELESIFDKNLFESNEIVFDNSSIILFGSYRLFIDNDALKLKVNQVLDADSVKNLEIIVRNFSILEIIVFKYIFTLMQVTQNYDLDISNKFCKLVCDECYSLEKDETKEYLLPYKNKLIQLYDDKTLQNIMDRYSYVLNVRRNGPKYFEVKMIRVLSGELSQNNIDNIKPLEKEIIRKCLLSIDYFPTFINKLMVYGEFNDGRSNK